MYMYLYIYAQLNKASNPAYADRVCFVSSAN